MSNSKKAALPVGDTTGKAEAGAGLAGSSTSSSNDTTTTENRQMRIAGLLGHGADHGLHLSDLVRLTGLPERTVRELVHQERRQHVPILSDNKNGYFLPDSEHEKAACVRSLRRRASEILEAAEGIEAAVVD